MQYSTDKSGSKLFLLAFVILLGYLAIFKFDFQKAYDFTVTQNVDIFKGFFQKL